MKKIDAKKARKMAREDTNKVLSKTMQTKTLTGQPPTPVEIAPTKTDVLGQGLR